MTPENRQPESPLAPQSPEPGMIPHSGKAGYETPVHDFQEDLPTALAAGEIHHVELNEAGEPVVDLPDTLGQFNEPRNSARTEAHQPLVETKVQPEQTTPKWKKWAAGLLGGAVLAGGGVAASKAMGSENSEPQPRTETGAPVEPEITAPTPEVTQAPELINSVVSVEKYPTALEAAEPLIAKIDEYLNYYGTAKNLTSTPLSSAQNAEHEAMLDTMFGPFKNSPEITVFATNLREAWTEANGYKSLTQQSIDAGYGEDLFYVKNEAINIVETSPNVVSFILDQSTNAQETEIAANMSIEYAQAIEADVQVTAELEQSNGNWYISSWQTQSI